MRSLGHVFPLASDEHSRLGQRLESHRFMARLGDLLAPIAEPLDLLVSNPPYLTEAEYATLDASVRDHEPRLALPSGEDGLDAIRRLLDDGRAVVREGGWIALELDCRRAAATAALAEGFGWREVLVQDDLFGRARYLLARRGSA